MVEVEGRHEGRVLAHFKALFKGPARGVSRFWCLVLLSLLWKGLSLSSGVRQTYEQLGLGFRESTTRVHFSSVALMRSLTSRQNWPNLGAAAKSKWLQIFCYLELGNFSGFWLNDTAPIWDLIYHRNTHSQSLTTSKNDFLGNTSASYEILI